MSSSDYVDLCAECAQLGLHVELVAGERRAGGTGREYREIVGMRASRIVIPGHAAEGVARVAVQGITNLDHAARVLSRKLGRRDYRDGGF